MQAREIRPVEKDLSIALLKLLKEHAIRANYFTPKELFFAVDLDPGEAVRFVNDAVQKKQLLFYKLGKSPSSEKPMVIVINPIANTAIFVYFPREVDVDEVLGEEAEF